MTPFLHRAAIAACAVAGGLLSASAAHACPDWSQYGSIISFSSDQLQASQTLSLTAGGADNLSQCPQPGHGYVETRPNFDFGFSANSAGRDLEFRVNASCDTVLLVNDATGRWHFDDDSGDGLNARLVVPSAPEGAYDIWVGTYGQSRCDATLTLATHDAGGPGPMAPAPCPDPRYNGEMLSHDADALRVPQRVPVVAGGNINLANCTNVPGHGYIIESPDFTLAFTGNPYGADLNVAVDGSCDPVLLVAGPDGTWHFNDDSDGLNSRLTVARAQPGEYDIWVGTYGSQTCDATLILETPGGSVPGQQPGKPSGQEPVISGCPDPSLTGQFISARTADLRSPRLLGVTAGGATNLRECGGAARVGYADASPQLTLDLLDTVRGGVLDLRVDGTCDTVLLVHDQQGRWSFSDDADGSLNPHLSLEGITPGQYDIWVGTYGPTACSATVQASVTGGMTPPAGPPVYDPAPNQISGRLLAAIGDSGRDLVGRGEALEPNGSIDGLYRFAVTAPGRTITSIVIQNTSGPLSIWDTVPNRHWVGAVLVNGRMMNRSDTTVSIPLGAGETVIDMFVQADANQFGRDGMRITVGLDSGESIEIIVPEGFSGSVQGGSSVGQAPSTPQPQDGFFAEAWFNGERVDGCLHYGRDCGQDAADRFCQHMGYIYAVDGAFSFVETSRTLVLGDSRICTIPNGCGALINVTCVPSPEALGEQGTMAPQGPSGLGDTVFGFNRDTLGWTLTAGTLSQVPGSHMHAFTPGDGVTGYLVAPAAVFGDWRGVRAIDVTVRSEQGRYFDGFDEDAIGDIVLFNGAMSAAVAFPYRVGADWTRFSIPVEDTRLWRLGGGAGSVSDVLSNVTAMWVRAEFLIGDANADFSEIAIRGEIRPATPPATPMPPAGKATR